MNKSESIDVKMIVFVAEVVRYHYITDILKLTYVEKYIHVKHSILRK